MPLAALREQAQMLRLPWRNVIAGDHFTRDDVQLRVVHPDRAEWERQRVRNDDSIVVDLRWRDVSMVLTGDIGKAVERTLSTRIDRAPLRVVKVPHHGSLTSSTTEFVRALAPRVAVISVGRANRFGHPVPEVVDRYREAGAEVFRTDRDGAVQLDSNGYELDIYTFTGRHLSVRTTLHHGDTRATN
jgi:competence protein ComEC